MKIISRGEFNHLQLKSETTGEHYSLSALISEALGSHQLFVHHDIIPPGQRSSGAHHHSVVEEMVYVVRGSVQIHQGDKESMVEAGAFALFEPQGTDLHFISNPGDQDAEAITFSMYSKFDLVSFETSSAGKMKAPGVWFDEELREVPLSLEEWSGFFGLLRNELSATSHPQERLELLGQLGNAARLLGKLSEAESYLKKALALSLDHPIKGRFIQNLIRLAHVYQWMKEYKKSQALFDQAKALLDENSVSDQLVAAYHQHLGKLYFDQGFFAKAQAEVATALSIRERVSAPQDQIESSRRSLDEALKRWGVSFSGILLRKALPMDAESLHRAHMSSIQGLCSKDHSLEEIQAWGHRPYQAEQRIRTIKEDLVWVIEIKGGIEGYGHLNIFDREGVRKGYVAGLYLTSTAAGRSLGRAMMGLMFEEARFAGVRQLELESSITARGFYRKMGFVESGAGTTVEIAGTPIRCVPMSMIL